jgi:hypothetical protein
MKIIPSVTLICVDCYNYGIAVEAIRRSLKEIQPYKAIFLTDIEIELDDIDVIQIPTIKNKKEYSRFVLKELRKYFHTTHCLLIQHDGFVLSGESWTDEFLKYDYIGAPWLYPDGHNVGNGGFSLRSHRLQMLLGSDSLVKPTHPEDENIGRLYRDYLETEYDIKYAPQELAEKFSYELNKPICKTFGFHGYFHPPYKPSVLIKRTGAMGDLIMAEPLMTYYYDCGYDVYLDTMQSNMDIFFNHPYPIKHVSQKHERLEFEKMVDLDMAYESIPSQNVLKTYFQFAGIELSKNTMYCRNSILNVNKNANKWFFEKYVIFHIDDTGIPYRNIRGIDWPKIEKFFKNKGYTVLQVGHNAKQNIGLHFNTEAKPMLMYLLAGADLIIGIDSGVAQLSVALGKKTIIFTGSVDLKLRYQDFEKIEVIKTPCPSVENEYCYHKSSGSVIGSICIFDKKNPPCAEFKNEQLITAIKKMLKK